ncbi:MAG: dipeptidase [Lachnospirales bacterium]
MNKYFDCHCDTLTKAMEYKQNLYDNKLHNSIKKLNKFNTPVQIFAIWLEKQYLSEAYSNTLQAIDFFENQVKKYSDFITTDYNDTSKLRGILSVEGGEACEGSIEKLNYLYEKGIRLMTLTWNYTNKIGHGALSGCNEGLSEFGKKVIKQMNKLNMIIDVSHLNEKGFYDVYNLSEKPFIASHSNAYSICRHKRNLTKEQIKIIADCGGIIGLNLYPVFVDGDKGTTLAILRHIDYMLNITEGTSLALGCDFDGISYCCEDLSDVGYMDFLYNKISEEFSKEIADSIFYDNMNEFILKNKIL